MIRQQWVKLPNGWIENRGLRQFKWGRNGIGSTNVASLMLLIVLTHHSHPETGYVRMTYEEIQRATGLSRAKISEGLKNLAMHSLVIREGAGHPIYRIAGYNPEVGYAKLPHSGLYRPDGSVPAFRDFTRRKVTELDAVKAYLLYASRRGRDTNQANISFEKIEEYSAIPQNRIRAANSFLINAGLINVQQVASSHSDYGISNAYSLNYLDSKRHAGTYGRRTIDAQAEPPQPAMYPGPGNIFKGDYGT